MGRMLTALLLKQRLAACVTLSGVCESHYVWKGKTEKSEEYLLLIKTKRTLFKRLEETLREHHPYEVPEIIALPITAGSKAYLNWLRQNKASTAV